MVKKWGAWKNTEEVFLYGRRDVEANENRLDMMLMHDENGNFMRRKRLGSYRKCTPYFVKNGAKIPFIGHR